MKKWFIASLLLLVPGCACVRVSTPSWTMTGVSLMKDVQVPKVQVKPDGSLTVIGYSGVTDNEAIGTAVGAAIKAAGR